MKIYIYKHSRVNSHHLPYKDNNLMYYLSDILYYVLVSEQMRNKFKYEKYNICNIVNQNTLKIASHGSLLSLS